MLVPPDPELEAISDRLRVISESLGFSELGEIGKRRVQLLREINIARGFDRHNPVHVNHLGVYQDLGIAQWKGSPNQLATSIGYHIAMARVWLEADDVGRFNDYMYGYEDDPRDMGALRALGSVPELDDTYDDLCGVLAYLESLNTNQPEEA